MTARWRDELQSITELMREISRLTDPHEAGTLYGQRLRANGFVPSDEYLALSRRGLEPPAYKMTRNTQWAENINPWQRPTELPIFTTGLLGELVYHGEPVVITDLHNHLKDDDPCAQWLRGFEVLVTLPQYDDGVALNVGVILARDAAAYPVERVPVMVWQANLWGRGVLNLVLRQQLQKAYDELERELSVVAEIQRSLLPEQIPQIPTLDIAAYYGTSRRAGGDYYDFLPLPPLSDGKWGIMLADVSGHGTPAAVVMAITHAIAHGHPGPPTPPGDVMRYLNRKLAARYMSPNVAFVTGVYAIYDPATRTLCVASAGHPPPRFLRHGRGASLAVSSALPLGIIEDETYPQTVHQLEPDDLLLFYTDGITEAFNPQGEMFGTERLDQVMLQSCAPRASGGEGKVCAYAACERVIAAVDAFTGNAPPSDDRTILAIRVTE